ncbi:SDR family oxidoreductase [Paenibacillus alvei]
MEEKNYKIAIIGGTGTVGRYIAKEAIQNGYQVRILVRNPDKLAFKDDKMEVIQGDLKNIDSIRELIKGCDIVINTFGQPMKDVPLFSSITEKVIQVMKELKVKRYIGVTGASLAFPEDKRKLLTKIMIRLFKAKFAEAMEDRQKEIDFLFRNKSSIDWTLVRLPRVLDSTEIGYIKESFKDMPGMKITNLDIATYIIKQIKNQKYVHKGPFISN